MDNKDLAFLKSEISSLRSDLKSDVNKIYDRIEKLDDKIDLIVENKILPLQLFKAKLLGVFSALALGGGYAGSKIDKAFFKNEKIKIERDLND